MLSKNFLSLLLVLVFSSLAACGSSDSKSSGEKKEDNSSSQETNQETSTVTIKDCVEGDNPLKEGESCMISDNKYTCESGKITGSGISVGGTFTLNEFKLYCE
jgi:ABC-type oligopeptide transport system substrate-binding subunit